MIARLALSLSLLLPGGCLYFPDAGRAATRGTIDKRDLKTFTIGGTTREEVLRTLGEPDVAGADGTMLGYWWYHSRGFAIVLANSASGMVGTRIHLCFKFDPESRLLRHKFVHLPEGIDLSPEEILTQW
jgi:hypothetical protein